MVPTPTSVESAAASSRSSSSAPPHKISDAPEPLPTSRQGSVERPKDRSRRDSSLGRREANGKLGADGGDREDGRQKRKESAGGEEKVQDDTERRASQRGPRAETLALPNEGEAKGRQRTSRRSSTSAPRSSNSHTHTHTHTHTHHHTPSPPQNRVILTPMSQLDRRLFFKRWLAICPFLKEHQGIEHFLLILAHHLQKESSAGAEGREGREGREEREEERISDENGNVIQMAKSAMLEGVVESFLNFNHPFNFPVASKSGIVPRLRLGVFGSCMDAVPSAGDVLALCSQSTLSTTPLPSNLLSSLPTSNGPEKGREAVTGPEGKLKPQTLVFEDQQNGLLLAIDAATRELVDLHISPKEQTKLNKDDGSGGLQGLREAFQEYVEATYPSPITACCVHTCTAHTVASLGALGDKGKDTGTIGLKNDDEALWMIALVSEWSAFGARQTSKWESNFFYSHRQSTFVRARISCLLKSEKKENEIVCHQTREIPHTFWEGKKFQTDRDIVAEIKRIESLVHLRLNLLFTGLESNDQISGRSAGSTPTVIPLHPARAEKAR